MAERYEFYENCFFCGKSFQMGQGVYAGRYIPDYKITCCKTCAAGNWDGIALMYEKKLIEHLEAEGIPIPSRNDAGYLPLGI